MGGNKDLFKVKTVECWCFAFPHILEDGLLSGKDGINRRRASLVCGELIQENSFEVHGDDRDENNSSIVVYVTEVSFS